MKMKMKLTSGLLGIVAILIASQANAATVRIDPASILVANGSSFQLTVAGADFPETIGGGFLLGWDTAILGVDTTAAAITGMETDLFGIGWDFSSVTVTTDPATPGKEYLSVLLGTSGAFTGAFDILTLDFTALQPGITTASLSLAPLNGSDWLSSDFITAIPVTYEGADITVGAVPVPAAVWLFGSGLIGLVGIARRRTQRSA